MSGNVTRIAPNTYRVTGHPTVEQFNAIGRSFDILARGAVWGPFSSSELVDMPAVKPYNVRPYRRTDR